MMRFNGERWELFGPIMEDAGPAGWKRAPTLNDIVMPRAEKPGHDDTENSSRRILE